MQNKLELPKSLQKTQTAELVKRAPVVRPLLAAIAASTGIFGGISALFIGLLCVVVHAVLPDDSVFDKVGTVLLIAAIPMMLVGSIFLDVSNPSRR